MTGGDRGGGDAVELGSERCGEEGKRIKEKKRKGERERRKEKGRKRKRGGGKEKGGGGRASPRFDKNRRGWLQDAGGRNRKHQGKP